MQVVPDYETVQRSLRWSCPTPDKIIEVRTLSQYRGHASVGYFNDPVLAANTIVNSDNDGIAGTYVTLNPVLPEAFARCSNRMVSGKAAVFTHDKEILERRGLLLDFDPVRLSGISSSDKEHQAALDYMREVTEALTYFHGFPVPCLIDSGNGGHAKYMLEALPNDQETTELIKNVLRALDAKFSNSLVTIDKSVFNAARIVRIPGTVARKGENTPERPHRISRILRDYDPLDTLRRSSLERVVSQHGAALPLTPKGAVRRAHEYPVDEAVYRSLNNVSRDRCHDWVPHLLGDLARPSGEGYRIASRDIGRDLEEDIFIGPMGIKDFGVADMGDATEGRRTAITLLSEIMFNGNKREAAAQLSMTLNVPMNEFEGKALQEPVIAPDPITMPAALMGINQNFARMSNTADIDILALRRLTWMVEDFVLNKHYTLLTAAPKIGKSTLARMLTASLLTGLPFLGRECPQVSVVYIAYEDLYGDLFMEIRNNAIQLIREAGMDPFNGSGADLLHQATKERLYIYAEKDGDVGFFNNVPRGREGLEFLRQEVAEHPEIKVMFVDPIRFLRDETTRSRNIVDQEYYEGLDFKAFAQETGVAVFGLHHANKDSSKKASEGNDPLTSIGGTAAVAGAAGNVIVFRGDRIPRGVEGHIGIYCSGRIGGGAASIMVTPRNGRFYLSPPDAEIFYLRKLTEGSGGGGGGRGRPTDGISGREVDVAIEKYLKTVKAATHQMIADTINVKKYTVESRCSIMVQMGILDRFVDEVGLFKVGSGPKPFVYRLKDQVRLPN